MSRRNDKYNLKGYLTNHKPSWILIIVSIFFTKDRFDLWDIYGEYLIQFLKLSCKWDFIFSYLRTKKNFSNYLKLYLYYIIYLTFIKNFVIPPSQKKKKKKKTLYTIIHSWCDSHFTSISTCGVWEARVRVQVTV